MQLNIALLQSEVATQTQSLPSPLDNRVPFSHPALEGLQNLTDVAISDVLNKDRLGPLATSLGMRDVIRWVPRKVRIVYTSKARS